jgi:hypothetical protein
MTINLENRKKIDFNMIAKATKKEPRTFTELLHITRLPRKTLNLRLKELCANGALIKRHHAYELNGASGFESLAVGSAKGLSGVFRNRRVKTGFMLIMLVICFSASGYVLARFLPLPETPEASPQPVILGSFTMALDINDVNDLYTWQVAVGYNQDQLGVLEVAAGDFLGEDFVFVNSTDSLPDEGLLLLGGTLKGPAGVGDCGKSGSGRLATIVFGYLTENYDTPEMLPERVFETFLWNSQLSEIPVEESTLTLSLVK